MPAPKRQRRHSGHGLSLGFVDKILKDARSVTSIRKTEGPENLGFSTPISEGVQMGQVAIYCRVSTDDQSCERQERDLRAFAKRAGHRIIGVSKETASGAKIDRAERKKVMALARAHEIDAILVTELSRWGRSTQDLVQTLDDLHSWKVSVLAQTGLSFDLSTASGKLMRTIIRTGVCFRWR